MFRIGPRCGERDAQDKEREDEEIGRENLPKTFHKSYNCDFGVYF